MKKGNGNKKKGGAPRVAILMGSDSDWAVMSVASERLTSFGVAHEAHVLSAHRSPEETARFARDAKKRGLAVFICGAGAAAHLAGAVSAQTTLPVLGRPARRLRARRPRRPPRDRADAAPASPSAPSRSAKPAPTTPRSWPCRSWRSPTPSWRPSSTRTRRGSRRESPTRIGGCRRRWRPERARDFVLCVRTGLYITAP